MKIHRLSELFPRMTDEEFQALKKDIGKHGLRDPITLYEDKILDGRHRFEACEELVEVDARFKNFEGTKAEAIDFVISVNVRRRHMTKAQHIIALLTLFDYSFEDKKDNAVDKHIGELTGISGTTISRCRKASSDKGLRMSMANGIMNVHSAWKKFDAEKTKGVGHEEDVKMVLDALKHFTSARSSYNVLLRKMVKNGNMGAFSPNDKVAIEKIIAKRKNQPNVDNSEKALLKAIG